MNGVVLTLFVLEDLLAPSAKEPAWHTKVCGFDSTRPQDLCPLRTKPLNLREGAVICQGVDKLGNRSGHQLDKGTEIGSQFIFIS